MHAFISHLSDWYLASLQTGGYPLIILLMAIESSVVPLPSEVIIPPAAYLAHAQGQMTPVGVVLAGVLGSWLGASAMYWASRLAGRPLVLRFGRWIWISPEQLERAERWSARFGPMGIFVSRLLPVIRHLIGIPSGIVKLNFLKYSLYTLAGALVWCVVLSVVGIAAGNSPALMQGDLKTVGLVVAAAGAVLGCLYYFFVYRFARAEPPAAA